jgi:hypothetical protein
MHQSLADTSASCMRRDVHASDESAVQLLQGRLSADANDSHKLVIDEGAKHIPSRSFGKRRCNGWDGPIHFFFVARSERCWTFQQQAVQRLAPGGVKGPVEERLDQAVERVRIHEAVGFNC